VLTFDTSDGLIPEATREEMQRIADERMKQNSAVRGCA
jgi:hypothetical protein